MNKKFYITAAIPYVNAKPHLGHALEYIQGDVIARLHRIKGDEVFYVSGADENSLKNVQAAEKEGITPQELCNRNASAFLDLLKVADISLDKFQRSSSKEHFISSQELWQKCNAKGDIYKKKYKGLYCVGCEAFYTREELDANGECHEHPGKKVEEIEEENYFFKLSNYQKEIEHLIESDVYRILPLSRKNEALGFIRQGLQDFSVSRSKERARGWGVPVPGDDSQIMYVWFDALNVYRSAAPEWWPADVHLIGKGIVRFHAAYWPGILMSAGLPLPKNLLVHGYITAEGAKMSKSFGNVIDPMETIEKYGADAVRYYLLREIPSAGDGDFNEKKFLSLYNSDLANGLGNLIARVSRLGETLGEIDITDDIRFTEIALPVYYEELFNDFRLNEALSRLWAELALVDKKINDEKPWEKEGDALKTLITEYAVSILYLANALKPFMPKTAEHILEQFKIEGEKLIIKKGAVLFPRL